MPVIKNYRQQIATPGPTQSPQFTGSQFGAVEGRAQQRLGERVQDTAVAGLQFVERRETNQITAALAEEQARKTAELDKINRSSQDPEDYERFNESVKQSFDEIGKDLSTPRARSFYEQAKARMSAQLLRNADQGQADLRGMQAVENQTKVTNSSAATLLKDPTAFKLQLDLVRANAQNLVDTGELDVKMATKLRLQNETAMAKAAIRGWAQVNPEHARKKLASGEFDEFLNVDQKAQMEGAIDQEIRAKQIELDQIRIANERAKKQQQSVTQDEFFTAYIDKKLTVDMIRNSNLNATGAGSKEHFYNLLKPKTGTDPRLKTDAAVFSNLLNRIHLPEGDPNKLVDEDEITRRIVNGLSVADGKFLRAEFQGNNTEEGKAAGNLKSQFYKTARTQIAKPNPVTGIGDPMGEEQYLAFMAAFRVEYAKGKKEGKTDFQLLDPQSKDYIGGMMAQYQRDLPAIMRDMTKGLKGKPIPDQAPRQPGETPQQYLNRIQSTSSGGN